MTLAVTILGDRELMQVSDRRYSEGPDVSEDERNKHILIRCDDALLSIVFSGLATFKLGSTVHRVDAWFAERLLDLGAPELPADRVVQMLEAEANALFRKFSQRPAHWFVVAGWVNAARERMRGWVVSNVEPGSANASIVGEFRTTRRDRSVTIIGRHDLIARENRRRWENRLGGGASPRTLLDPILRTIADAARRDLQRSISESCSSVILSAGGRAEAAYHRRQTGPESFGPSFLWFESGVNILVANADVLPGGRYSVEFGREGTFVQKVEHGAGPTVSAETETVLTSQFQGPKHHQIPQEQLHLFRIVRPGGEVALELTIPPEKIAL